MSEDGYDPWLDLVERLAARGANIKIGNLQQDMIKHLLDTVEEQDVRIRGLEDALRRRDGGTG